MLTIAWDVDDILNNLMGAWLEQKWKAEHPECGLLYPEITENSPHRLLGTELEAYTASLDEFRLSPGFQALEPNPMILDWFKAHGHKARHMALTAVPQACAHISAEWVIRHFGQWIRTFHFVPSFRQAADHPDYDRTKADFMEWFPGIDALIEDNEKNAGDAVAAGVEGLLVDRPWNSSEKSMKEILRYLEGII